MTKNQWNVFSKFRNEFKAKCDEWSKFSAKLTPLQKKAAKNDTPPYSIENSVVYNTDLDTITENSEIKLIVIGDNPGKNEQLSKNQKYLVGQAGKIAQGFFAKNSELQTDFRKNVIILNKTPIHTAKTNHLKSLNSADFEISELILETQIWMAQKTAELHKNLLEADKKNEVELWLVGYSELKSKGIFSAYRNKLLESYKNSENSWQKVKVFQHFSMNRFSIDLKKFSSENPNQKLAENISKLGEKHRIEIFGE